MINKIKDKQTGEYHDIGGLKCKLVDTGTLEYDEGYNGYKPIYNFIKNKFYIIVVGAEENEDFSVMGLCTKNGTITTQMTFDSGNAYSIYFSQFDNHDAYIRNHIDDNITLYDGSLYKIYELPFALEV